MTYEVLEPAEGGIVVNFDHDGFADIGGVRDWMIGWATKMLALKKYAVTGEPDPSPTLSVTRVICKRRPRGASVRSLDGSGALRRELFE